MRILLPVALLLIALFFMFKNRTAATAATGATVPQAPPPPADTVLIVLDHMRFDTLLNNQPNITLLDLRTPAEFAAGHIWRSSNLSILDPLFDNRLAALGKENEYALYDASGASANDLGSKMKAQGYKRIYVLKDGLIHWSETGRPLQLR
jgi:phage shock protein E